MIWNLAIRLFLKIIGKSFRSLKNCGNSLDNLSILHSVGSVILCGALESKEY